jgi:hypothetical protein
MAFPSKDSYPGLDVYPDDFPLRVYETRLAGEARKDKTGFPGSGGPKLEPIGRTKPQSVVPVRTG